ncbi:MFS transporter [Streptomyces sp. ISL-11]|uniref:MFS transporter n=1 Tax=Streptomyces sp. ISL-11 TaxID=2819174 RepID=UPI001BE689A1|nr:MFS transporter [Streptomyces sp. ISL-11]MBT2387152.1 MFS transporter [Streptomyces sp. ISL-11]
MVTHTDGPTGHRPQPPTGSRPILLTLLLASMLTTMAGAIIAPSLPAMEKHFSAVDNSAFLVRMVLTVPALMIALGAPFVGTLVDRVGRKPVLTASVALFGLAGGSGLLLDNLYAILAGRLLLGVAVAGIMTATTTLVTDYYPGQARSRVLGLQAGFMGFGGVAFLSLGGVLADLTWRGPFAIYLVAVPLTALVLRYVNEPPAAPAPQATDGRRATARFPALAYGIYALVLISQIIFYTVPSQLPFYLKDIGGIGASGAGLAIALMSLANALVGLNYGRINQRFAFKPVAIATFTLLATGFAAIGASSSLPLVLLGLVIVGSGIGLLIPNLNTWLASRTPAALRGRVLGGVTSCLFLGQFLSPALTQPMTGPIGIDGVYLATAALAALVVAALLLLRTPAAPAPRPATAPATAEQH